MDNGQKVAEDFMKLPKRAQIMWFRWLEKCHEDNDTSAVSFALSGAFNVKGCMSPIETIFSFAMRILAYTIPDDPFVYGLHMDRQVVIRIGENHRGKAKTYIADFVLKHENATYDSQKLVIECDGHEFHESTKEQVAYDNERDLFIKSSGYDIIHFSGTQIYRKPIGCARKAYEYFKTITKLGGN